MVVSSASQGQRFRVHYALEVHNEGDHYKSEEALEKKNSKKGKKPKMRGEKNNYPGEYKFEELKGNCIDAEYFSHR